MLRLWYINIALPVIKPCIDRRIVAHGGLVASLLMRASADHAFRRTGNKQLVPASSQLNYFAPSSFGPITVQVEEVKLNSRSGLVRVQLWQQKDQAKPPVMTVEATITLQDPSTWQRNKLNLVTRTDEDGKNKFHRHDGKYRQISRNGQPFYRFKPGMVVSHAPDTVIELGKGAPHPEYGPSVIECWHKGDENWGINHLGFLSDHVGPILMNFPEGRTYRQLSQNITVEVVKTPPEGGWEWLFIRQEMIACANGRFWIEVRIMDEDRQLVALGRHQCVARQPEKYESKSKL